jgi:hypothetical protein
MNFWSALAAAVSRGIFELQWREQNWPQVKSTCEEALEAIRKEVD